MLRGDSGFSTYTLTAAGVWTYTLDNSNAAVQALNVGQTLTDTFTAFTVDGTAQLVTITINGSQRRRGDQRRHQRGRSWRPAASTTARRARPTATGDLNSTDVDNPNDAWTAVGTPTASANGYGSYTLTAAGVWTYTLNNNNADRAGAQCRADADRHLHRHHGRRHPAAGDHHHQRRERRRQ